MDRMGHSVTRGALIHQHRTSLRDKLGNLCRSGLSHGVTCGAGIRE
jgi:hypothetical protein